MFLVNYSSSSDSEDEKSVEVLSKSSKLKESSKTNSNRLTLPQATTLLGKRKSSFNNADITNEDITNDPTLHDGRIRSFKHERGNWATYVYVPVANNILEDIQDMCLLHLADKLEFKASSEMHISLSKTVVLQYHFIESFVETLQTTIQTIESFTVSLNNLKVYTNAERTRTFLAVKVDDMYLKKMLCILHNVDRVMEDFKLSKFYEDPSFHISILWCIGDNESVVNTLLPTIMETLKELLSLDFKINTISCKIGFKEFNFKLK